MRFAGLVGAGVRNNGLQVHLGAVMDEMVRAALAKWPNVPDCYGWLTLDQRGQWRLGEERQIVTNASINTFIARNYDHDEKGRWLFQNGPQRVFVSLDYTPWVWRIAPHEGAFALTNHIGQRLAAPDGTWLDENGRFLIEANNMVGVLHDHDAAAWLDLLVDDQQRPLDNEQLAEVLDALATAQASNVWLAWPRGTPIRLEAIDSRTVAGRFGFDPSPHPGPS
jgi:hypothetical protein